MMLSFLSSSALLTKVSKEKKPSIPPLRLTFYPPLTCVVSPQVKIVAMLLSAKFTF